MSGPETSPPAPVGAEELGREAFETWAHGSHWTNRDVLGRYDTGGYVSPSLAIAWEVWRAARATAAMASGVEEQQIERWREARKNCAPQDVATYSALIRGAESALAASPKAQGSDWNEEPTPEQSAEIENNDGPLSRGELHPWDFYKIIRAAGPKAQGSDVGLREALAELLTADEAADRATVCSGDVSAACKRVERARHDAREALGWPNDHGPWTPIAARPVGPPLAASRPNRKGAGS